MPRKPSKKTLAVRKAKADARTTRTRMLKRAFERLMQQQARPVQNPFSLPKFPEDAKPKAPEMALDDAFGSGTPFAWAAQVAFSSFKEGTHFLGFPYLSELAQRAEYRRMSETLATEMTRKWIKLKAKGTEDKTDKIEKILDEFERLDVEGVVLKALEMDGQFGRGHIYIDTGDTDNRDELKISIGDGRDDTSKAKVSKGKPVIAIKAVEPVWCYPIKYNANDPLKMDWYNPQQWMVMGKEVHCTRLLTLISRPVPDILKAAYAFGGLPLSQMAKPYVDNWLRTRQSISDLLHAYSVMVLATQLDADLGDESALVERVELFNKFRDNLGTMLIDKNTEDFKNVSASLSGLNELQAQSQEHMAAVSGIPLVKLLGIQPQGLNADSEGVMRSFYDWIKAQQKKVLKRIISTILWFVQLSLFGEVDKGIVFDFESLRELDEKEEAELRDKEADTHAKYVDMGAVRPDEVRKVLSADEDSPYSGIDLDQMPMDMPDIDITGEDPPDDRRDDPDPRDDRDRSGRGREVQPRREDRGRPGRDGAVVPFAHDDAGFKESDHPRDNDGKFTSGGGGGGGSTAHNVAVASVLSQSHQTGSEALKKTQALIKATTDPAQKAELVEHYTHQLLKKHKQLTAKGSNNADKYLAHFNKMPEAAKAAAMKKYGTPAGMKPASAAPSTAPASSAATTPVQPALTGEVTTSELEKAKSKAPLPLSGFGVDPGIYGAIEQFNKQYTGENTPTTEEGLKQKVLAFKQIQKAKEIAAKEKVAKETAGMDPETKKHLDSLASMGDIPASVAKSFVDYAEARIKSHGIKGITPGEAAHIVAYSGHAYKETNEALREGVMDEARWKHVKELNRALEKLPAHVGVTRRGAKLGEKVIALYKPGMIVEERGFMSTSKNSGFAGNVKFEIHGKTGRDISQISSHPSEAEVLFRSGTRFKVLSNDGAKIVMEEVE